MEHCITEDVLLSGHAYVPAEIAYIKCLIMNLLRTVKKIF